MGLLDRSLEDYHRELSRGILTPGPQRHPVTLPERVQQTFGLLPDVQRGTILPVPPQSVLDGPGWNAPQWLYEMAKALTLPGHIAAGGSYTDEDALNMAFTVAGGGAAATTKAVPRGAVAMGGSRPARGILPMDEASRMARAREMGFDPDTPLYHGTDRDFAAFDTELSGANTGNQGFLGRGHYLATTPRDAQQYGDFVMPLMARGTDILDLRRSYREIAEQLPDLKMRGGKKWKDAFREMDDLRARISDVQVADGEGGFKRVFYKVGNEDKMVMRRVSPLEVSTPDDALETALSYEMLNRGMENPANIGALGNYFGAEQVRSAMERAGFKGARSSGTNIGDVGDEVVIFDPRNIRSRFAKFDPSKSDSADLLAANYSPWLSGGLLATDEERRQRRY